MAIPTPELIAGMTYLELESLARMVAERMHELREHGLEQLHDELEQKAADLGVSLAELMAIAKKKRRRPRAHKDNSASVHAE
jgi:hypothetical protein